MTLIPQEKTFSVAPLTITGQLWSTNDSRYPVLALHGWMDNSASFQPLAQHLTCTELLALDLAGHGTSSWRSEDASYNLWLDVAEILAVADQQGWEQFALLGHSRGAMIAMLLAAVAPERVSKVALIDGFLPIPVDEADAPQQLAKSITEKKRYLNHRRRRFSTLEELAQSRTRGPLALTPEAAQLMAARGASQCEEGYRWSADPRLQAASEVKFTRGQLQAFAAAVEAPVELYAAEDGLISHFDKVRDCWELVSNKTMVSFAGGHHCHMEKDSSAIARRFEAFLGAP